MALKLHGFELLKSAKETVGDGEWMICCRI